MLRVPAGNPCGVGCWKNLADTGLSLAKMLAPEISGEMGRHLQAQGALYLDKQGNCNVVLGDAYVARIEGRRVAHRTPRGQTSMRAAGYKVLFALLAEADLVEAPLRTIADRAGASRQAASDALARLAAAGLVDKHKDRHRWVPHRNRSAFERWLVGYADVLRPALLIGSFRTPDATPDKLEQRIVEAAGPTTAVLVTRPIRGDRRNLTEFREVVCPDGRGRRQSRVWDNLNIHNDVEIAETIERCGARLEFLPPYSPDLNPIEKAWSKMKSVLRKLKARTREALIDALGIALRAISKQDCIGWFRHAGYMLP